MEVGGVMVVIAHKVVHSVYKVLPAAYCLGQIEGPGLLELHAGILWLRLLLNDRDGVWFWMTELEIFEPLSWRWALNNWGEDRVQTNEVKIGFERQTWKLVLNDRAENWFWTTDLGMLLETFSRMTLIFFLSRIWTTRNRILCDSLQWLYCWSDICLFSQHSPRRAIVTTSQRQEQQFWRYWIQRNKLSCQRQNSC